MRVALNIIWPLLRLINRASYPKFIMLMASPFIVEIVHNRESIVERPLLVKVVLSIDRLRRAAGAPSFEFLRL